MTLDFFLIWTVKKFYIRVLSFWKEFVDLEIISYIRISNFINS